ncbi:STAS domain-containing protein [Amycolatopsis acidiphila]|uniref:Anti-sigma factor antagonist n=1 Tax=Amycolatopsis acidiphila TaxID=715473 RepID=A0A558AGC1_9PSEU|nr:STAS domain-containing protein [Amycolatopsis acidiphila]TVT23319.1 STAS domain-containing protein [Amycolatopsis acidiphila]UIJ56545.1 STAS domain-containing protein [Amycolatopsis acidiphila]GHG66718.1 anti-sigma factor antagonist [Amycolatopsis acidiphila]
MSRPPESRVPRPRRAPDTLEFVIRTAAPGAVVLEVAGEVDMVTAPQLADALEVQLGRDVRVVVVELARVSFLGSSGLAVLVNAFRSLDPGKAMLIVAPYRAAYRAFALTGLADQLPLYRSFDAALASL